MGIESEKIENFWQEFCSVNSGIDPLSSYQVWYFGNTPEMAEKLLHLVLSGKKTATAAGVWEFDTKPEEMPLINGLSVVTDFDADPKLILRTTEIRILPFNEVDARFAFDEGEGDQSLEFWRKVHWDYFTKSLALLGKEASEDMPIICERFEVLYPKSDEF